MHVLLRRLSPLLLLLGLAGLARADAPFSLERLFGPPWVFGVGMRSVAFSDDGAFLACGWDQGAEGHRDLWVLDLRSGVWCQRTDLWPDREARLRRDFSRDLRKARAEWEKQHAGKDDKEEAKAAEVSTSQGASSADASTASADDGDKKVKEFDEAKRIEDFEKDLKKQRDNFGGVSEIVFRRSGHELFYIFDGALYSLDLDAPQSEPRLRLKHEQGFSALSLPPRDSTGTGPDALMLQSDADVLLWFPAAKVGAGEGAGCLREVTTGGNADRPHTEGYAITPDLRWLAAVTRDYTAARKTHIPDLLPADPATTDSYHVRPGDTPETVSLALYDLSTDPPWQVDVKLPDEPYYQVCAIDWSPEPGAARLLLGVITGDTHELKVYFISPPPADDKDPNVELVYRERDDKWLNWDRTSLGWDGAGGLVLQSEWSGKAAVYRLEPRDTASAASSEKHPNAAADAAGGAGKQQLSATAAAGAGEQQPSDGSTGKAEDWGTHVPVLVYEAEQEVVATHPLARSRRAVIECALPDPSYRSLFMLDLATGQAAPLVSAAPILRRFAAMNDAETLLAYTVGDEHHMDNVALLRLGSGESAGDYLARIPVAPAGQDFVIRDRLGDSAQADSGWQQWADSWDVRFITVPGEHGPVPVKLYLPPGHRPDGRYPLLLWAHGAGYAQTAVRTPGFYELFHPWVAGQLGWIAAEVDYRGSSGYGRDWRVDVWGRLGHGEVDDLVAMKHYLMEHYGADPERTALWGWSYGGYLTLMALGLKPSEFPVGCAVAPVTRWENYFQWFAQERLGLPADNPDEYERSSAETYLKDVKDHLLIIHGLRDDNTVFQSIAQYLEKSHELGVNVELKLFPSDTHGISNEHHYLRVFQAIVEFCEASWAENAKVS